MNKSYTNFSRGWLIFVLCLPCAAALADDGFVAGLKPYERPAGAPVIAQFVPDDTWRAQAMKGIGEPQTGTDFLKDQGAWYTPFNRPNLPGRYDIRGLHRNNDKKD